MKTDEYYIDLVLKLAKKAYKHGEVPIGALIVCNGKIISKAYNRKEKTKKVIDHAEIIAISKACKKKHNWRLENCTIYISMEPCMMCVGAINQARIKKVVYSTKNDNFGFSKYLDSKIEQKQIENKNLKLLVQQFFYNKRK